ncbi:MAG: response regulator transcription factor [Turicibacter sp.]|nr:response regulator transcription factor [Turicibacter sp.]
MYKILIVEDNVQLSMELSCLLKKEGYEVEVVTHFEEVVNLILKSGAHLVLLDINLPYDDGYYIAKEVRKQSQIPMIMVTSRDTEMDELMSMNLGADDFITKPYNVNILRARIQNLLKRSYPNANEETLSCGNWRLLVNKSLVICGDSSTELTKNEFRILYYLLKNKNTIVTRVALMAYLWDSNVFIDDNTLTVNVGRLRKKLDGIGVGENIQTKRGMGYYL